MKRTLLILVILLITGSAMADNSSVKFYLKDGSSKNYQINEVKKMSFINKEDSFLMKLYLKNKELVSKSTMTIDSINFQIIDNKATNLLIYYNNTILNDYYHLAEIDSIVFAPLPTPIITSVKPNLVKKGSVISITGSNFGSSQSSSVIQLKSQNTKLYINSISKWTDTQIDCKFTDSVFTGLLSIVVNSKPSNEVEITAIPSPKITSINPSSFSVGDVVTINGFNFGKTQDVSTILFNTINAKTITSWSDTKIVCKVPETATTGVLIVTANGIPSNAFNYKLISSVVMVTIPSGSFQMGNTGSYSGMIYIQETPVHNVTISNDFYMSKYEVSQELYLSVIGTNPSVFKSSLSLPVEKISWYDAVNFCNKLSIRDGFKQCYTINGTNVSCDWDANGYRLPTEAEWEYACKAGTTTDYYNGNKESDLVLIGWINTNSGDSTHLPGLLKPNNFGLYDMIGSVFEWVWDWRGDYNSNSVTDPKGPSSGLVKIIRGGSWHNGLVNGMCRSSFRGWEDNPALRSSTDGIRLVRMK